MIGKRGSKIASELRADGAHYLISPSKTRSLSPFRIFLCQRSRQVLRESLPSSKELSTCQDEDTLPSLFYCLSLLLLSLLYLYSCDSLSAEVSASCGPINGLVQVGTVLAHCVG